MQPTLVCFQELDGRLEDSGLVHLFIAGGHHGAKLVDKKVELVSSLLLAEVASFPAHEHTHNTIVNRSGRTLTQSISIQNI